MKTQSSILTCLTLLALAAATPTLGLAGGGSAKSAAAPAQGRQAASKPADQKMAPAATPTQMPPEMEAYMKLATPGEPHKRLERLAGNWTTHLKAWMGPGQPAVESDGSMTANWQLGGRFMEMRYTGNMMGMQFEGRSLQGYDNATHQYVSSWVDNMGTGIMSYKGSCDADCKVLTMTADFLDPMSGKKMTDKGVTTFVDANTFRYESYMIDGEGHSFKDMEMEVRRSK